MVSSAVPMRIWAPALALLCSALPLAMAQSPLGPSPQGAVETCTDTSAPGSLTPVLCVSAIFKLTWPGFVWSPVMTALGVSCP